MQRKIWSDKQIRVITRPVRLRRKGPKQFLDCFLRWAISLLLAFPSAWAYAGLENRPLNADDAYTIEQGTASLSVGSVFQRRANHDKQTDLVTDVSMSPFPRLEVGLEIPYTFLKPKGKRHETSFGDLTVRPEVQLLEEGKYRPAFSTWIAVKTQTGDEDEGIGSGATDVSLAWNLSKKFPGPTWFHVNLGLTLSGESEGEARDNVFFYKIAGEYSPWERFKFVGEIVGQTNPDPLASHNPLEWLLGIIYDTRKGILFDTGFGTGFTNASPDIRVTAGVTCVL